MVFLVVIELPTYHRLSVRYNHLAVAKVFPTCSGEPRGEVIRSGVAIMEKKKTLNLRSSRPTAGCLSVRLPGCLAYDPAAGHLAASLR